MVSKNVKKLIKIFKTIDIVRKENISLKYAGNSSVYIDIKKAYGYPEAMKMMCKLIKERMPKKIDCIAAGGYGGLPLAGALAEKYNLKLVLVREKPKAHGRNVWIDGYVPNKGEKVWIIDDVFTTGGSIKQMIKTINLTKAKAIGCSVVVKRTKRKMRVACNHILTINDLV